METEAVGGLYTVTVAEIFPVLTPTLLVQFTHQLVAVYRAPVPTDPEVPLPPHEVVQALALVEDQERVEEPP